MEVLVRKSFTINHKVKYSEMVGSESGERWVLIDNHGTKKNSVMVRYCDLVEFINQASVNKADDSEGI